MRTLQIFLLIVFFLPVTLLSQNEKFDAVYENLVREYTLNPDGSLDYRFVKKLKLQTYRSFNSLYGETFIPYDTVFQHLKINEVYTVMADGKKVPAPANAFNPSLPGYAANAPAYNTLREMVITHTGLEKGAVVFLDFQIHTEKNVFPFLMGNELLAESEPVQSLEIKVRIPEDKELFYNLLNGEEMPVRTVEKGFKVYTWKRSNVPAISSEDYQPGGYAGYPRLLFSVSGKMEEVLTWFSAQAAFKMSLSGEMKNKVAGVLKESHDPVDLTLKIQEIVADQTRFYPVPLTTALFRCRTPEQTWNSNGGTAVEKAVLMAALLKQAGTEATPVAIVRTSWLDKKIGSLLPVEDFCVRADLKEKGAWYLSVHDLNPVNLKNSLSGRTLIMLDSEGKFRMEETGKARQMVKVNGTFLVSSDPKLTGEISLYLEGQTYPRFGLFRDKQKLRNSLTGQLIQNDSVALKKSALNNDNGYQVFTVQSDKPFRKDTNLFFFRLPVMNNGIDGWNLRTMSMKRETAFELPVMADESYSYTFTLPEGLSLFTGVQKKSVKNDAGVFNFEIKTEKGKWVISRSLRFSDQDFPVEKYADLKELLDSWNNPWYKQVVLRKN